MSILNILEYPDKRLRNIARPIELIDASLSKLIEDMFETMYQAPGIGLAATQVNVHLQLVVLDVSEDKSQPLVLINPVITAHHGSQVYQEGCLSLPNIYADVKRYNQITVSALDRHGKELILEADGLLAVCIQHEMDHLIGKVFVDHLSPLKRALAEKKLAKQRKLNAEEA
ncbi:MAG: peptide deformylase [Arenimonas sp.]|nr:peptide deformylase [Arenimonas sp.]